MSDTPEEPDPIESEPDTVGGVGTFTPPPDEPDDNQKDN
jgi:hypothetical protein